MEEIIDIIKGHGHPNITATHKTTLEVSREEYLTLRGNCIVVIGADKGALQLSDNLKKAIRMGAMIRVTIEVDNLKDEIIGYGHPKIELNDPISIVVRKSSYICPRTLMIKANKAASDIDRRLINKIKKEYWKEVVITITAKLNER